jgi:hypothetical protein
MVAYVEQLWAGKEAFVEEVGQRCFDIKRMHSRQPD